MDFESTKNYIITRLSNELPPKLYYHGLHHTLDVLNSSEKLAALEGVSGEDLILLKTGALFHDAGFIEQYSNNEIIAVRIAKEALPRFGFDERQTAVISEVILATDRKAPPKTELAKILCDADLDHLGRNDFNTLSDFLKKELHAYGYIYSDIEWDNIQIKFLENHLYYTNAATVKNNAGKQKHLNEIKERLKKNS